LRWRLRLTRPDEQAPLYGCVNTSLEPAPKRKPLENQMGVHNGTCCHWNAEARFGFVAMDAPIVEVADRDLYAAGARCNVLASIARAR
jgi:hypothetical protein